MAAIELTPDEIRLLRNALASFEHNFGHDEADVLHAVQRLAAKLDALAAAGPLS
jgi:hypothetical protein